MRRLSILALAFALACGAKSELTTWQVDVPRPLSPLSTATVTSQRPTLRWVVPHGAVATRVEICRDRACAIPLRTFVVHGSQLTLDEPLPPGAVFVRYASLNADGYRSAYGPTWQLDVGHGSAPHDASWGSLPDFDGDGRPDVVVSEAQPRRTYVLLAREEGHPRLLDGIGWDIASAGDVDGDGFADLLASEPCEGDGCGRVHLHRGGPDGPSAAPDAVLSAPVDAPGRFGWSIAGAGDVDADGYADVVVAARCAPHPCVSGTAYLYRGGPRGLERPPSTLHPPDGAAIQAVASAGDTNGDGFADVAIATSCTDAVAPACEGGHVYVYMGSSTGLGASPFVSIAADREVVHGGALVAAGDLDGDGYADVIVGTACDLFDCERETRIVHVHPGGPSGPSPVATITLAFQGVATVVEVARDVDGDGFDDLLVGILDTGRVELHRGGPDGLDGVAADVRAGRFQFGLALAGAGDLDGDGFDDVLIGDPGFPDPGLVVRVRGAPGGFAPSTSDERIESATPRSFDSFGGRVL